MCRFILFSVAAFFCSFSSYAQTYRISDTVTGTAGLNTTPSARMHDVGTFTAGLGYLDPYFHGYFGIQLTDFLSVTIRQSAEVSNINENADRLYPGLDFKLRLLDETRIRPAVALGFDSAIGHKRTAGEYLVFSKRYNEFDFTAGLGWGRYGQAGHFENPFKIFASHFNTARSSNEGDSNGPDDWFTGRNVGFFGGLEYFTPIHGLSLKADWSADRYRAETLNSRFSVPSPWGLGLSYTGLSPVHMGIGIQGTDKIMGRVAFSQNLKDQHKNHKLVPFQKFAQSLKPIETSDGQLHTFLPLQIHGESTPFQIRQAVDRLLQTSHTDKDALEITSTVLGLKGPSVTLLRRDLETYVSPQELWHHAAFSSHPNSPFIQERPLTFAAFLDTMSFILDTEIDLSKDDRGALYRSALLTKGQTPLFFGFLDTGYTLRFNLGNNFTGSPYPENSYSVRSNIQRFSDSFIGLDNLWLALTHTSSPDLHIALIGGYLEEMYGGIGGEILYRPFKSRLSFGTDVWKAYKRDPHTDFHLGFTDRSVTTGHGNIWYDWPDYDFTLGFRAGRYLAGDIGGTVSLSKKFKNGSSISGFVTVTDQSDRNIYGEETQAHHGLQVSIPLGMYSLLPRNTTVQIKTAPLGRETGQSLDMPLSLHTLTDRLSYAHMSEYWNDIVR